MRRRNLRSPAMVSAVERRGVTWTTGTLTRNGPESATFTAPGSPSRRGPGRVDRSNGAARPAHAAQEAAIAGYIRWANRHARPKRRFAPESKIRRPDYLPNVA